MYSRNRVNAAEQRYAENLPPVYGGSRFYRGTSAAPRDDAPRRETEPAMTPAVGIPVEYAVRPGGPPDTPRAEREDVSCPAEGGEECASSVLFEETPREDPDAPAKCASKPSREGGIASLLTGDSEEILLIVLILLLGGEAERAADVIVILLLLLVVR